MNVQLKRPKKKKLKPKINIKLLKRDSNIKELYSVSVRNKFEIFMDESEDNTTQMVYDSLSTAIEEAGTEILPKVTKATLDD